MRPRRVRALSLHGRRGLPVRLIGRLGDHRRRAGQIAGRSLQTLLQPRLPSPGLSAADPRDAVRAHNHAFRVLGGVPRRGIYDNMRSAVDKVGRGKERQVDARFSAMVSHFLFEAEFCNPASGSEKGQIEKNVQDARHRLWQPMPSFPSAPRR